jgi:PhnB protein
MKVEPYLFFEGRCDEAVEFYRSALGAQVEALIRNKEHPDSGMCVPGAEDKVMHAALRIGDTTLMASDGMNSGKPNFQGISLAITVDDDAQAKQRFDALAEGGQVQQPLAKAFFASSFGMVADRFGVSWMVVTKS